MKRALLSILSICLIFSLVSCGKKDKTDTQNSKKYPDFKVALAIDEGGVEDDSFNQSAWEAAKDFSQSTGASVMYQEADGEKYYYKNFEILAQGGYDIIWCIGFNMQEQMKEAAKKFPDQLFAIVDADLGEDIPKNIISISFSAQQSAFLSGYIASRTTKTNNLGFVKGSESVHINAFENGFKAGVAYGAKELGKEINVFIESINTYDDASIAQEAANKLINKNCDIIHQCAGAAGLGVINVCKNNGIYAIGVDKDQNYVAPKTVLTSSMKQVGSAIYTICLKVAEGENLGGTNQILGIESGCTGVCPSSDKTVPKEIMDKVYVLAEKIKTKEIIPPKNENEYNEFIKTLK